MNHFVIGNLVGGLDFHFAITQVKHYKARKYVKQNGEQCMRDAWYLCLTFAKIEAAKM